MQLLSQKYVNMSQAEANCISNVLTIVNVHKMPYWMISTHTHFLKNVNILLLFDKVYFF